MHNALKQAMFKNHVNREITVNGRLLHNKTRVSNHKQNKRKKKENEMEMSIQNSKIYLSNNITTHKYSFTESKTNYIKNLPKQKF